MLPEIDEKHPRIIALREGLAAKIPVPAENMAAREELQNLDLGEVLWAWTNWAYRGVPRRKRQVIWPADFESRALTEPEAKAVKIICDRIEAGDDIAPFLSEKNETHGYTGSSAIGNNRPKWLDNGGDKDLALNAYQTHHLHLGEYSPQSKYSSRTNRLLYVFFNRIEAYIVHLGNHKSFNDGTLAQAAARLHAYRGFSLNGVVGLSHEHDELRFKRLERAGISSTRQTDFGFSPSMILSQGHSLVASSHADDCWHTIAAAEQRMDSRPGLIDFFQEIGIDPPKNPMNAQWGMMHCDLTIGNSETNVGKLILPGPL